MRGSSRRHSIGSSRCLAIRRRYLVRVLASAQGLHGSVGSLKAQRERFAPFTRDRQHFLLGKIVDEVGIIDPSGSSDKFAHLLTGRLRAEFLTVYIDYHGELFAGAIWESAFV